MSHSTDKQRSKRLRFVRVAAIGLFGVAAYSQAKVQLIDRSQTLERARETHRFQFSKTEFAKRGVILSVDGKPLAQDRDTYLLRLSFSQVPQSDGFFVDLSEATGIPASEFSALAAGGTPNKEWRTPMTADQAQAVNRVKTHWRADGVSLTQTGQRDYPLADAASGVVGSMRDRAAVSGLENSLDATLAGRDGKTVGLVDRTGAFLPMRLEDASVAKKDGDNVTLTIDSELQAVAAAAVKEAVEAHKADSGVAVVMDPTTGDVLAMAKWPSVDPVTLQGPKDAKTPDADPNYMFRLEPGSMMKILTLAKALDKGVVKPDEHFHCNGTYQVTPKSKPIKCDSHHGNRAHGELTPEMAIARSCNICAAQWALRIGYDDYVQYIKDLGLLQRVDVGLPNEAAGRFDFNDPAHQLQLACVGFGQSIGVTPLALAGAFTALGNGGVRMQPRLIKRIGAQEEPINEGGRMFTAETADRVLQFMQSVIETDQGTGKKLRIPGYRLAGKTGTAQRIGRAGGGYVANFVGYVPAVHPRAQVLVMIDHPTSGDYYGATVAGPVFVKIARSVIREYDLKPTEALDAGALPAPRASPKEEVHTKRP